MSEPFTVVRVGQEGRAFFHARTGAQDLAERLFWGPDGVETLLETTPRFALEELGAQVDGGAIVDDSQRSLRVWSAGDEQHDVPARRVLLDMMATTWRGWDLDWVGVDGLREHLIDALGWDETDAWRVFSTTDAPPGTHAGPPPGNLSWLTSVLSVRHRDGALRFYTADLDEDPPLAPLARLEGRWYRPALRGPTELDLSGRDHPWSGTHVDLPGKTVDYWTACLRRVTDDVSALFPGFTVTDHGDRFEQQLRLCGSRLRFRERSASTLVRAWQDVLLDDRAEFAPPLAERTRRFDTAREAVVRA